MSPKKSPSKRKPRPIPRPNPIYPPPRPKPFPKPKPRPTEFKLKPVWLKAAAAIETAGGRIVREILWEIENAVALAGKTLSNDAFQEFRPALLTGINNKLGANGNWTTDGANVRASAALMGTFAAALANPSGVVAKAHVHAAFYAVRDGSTICANAGGGSWCDFFI